MVVYVSFASTVLCPTDAGTTSAQSRRLSGWWPRWQAVPVHVADATRVCVREGGETVLDALIANGVNAWMASESPRAAADRTKGIQLMQLSARNRFRPDSPASNPGGARQHRTGRQRCGLNHRQGVREVGLAEGSPVTAVIKASDVIVATVTDTDPVPGTGLCMMVHSPAPLVRGRRSGGFSCRERPCF